MTHAEASVESLQAQLWSGAFDAAMFDEGVLSACIGQQLHDAAMALGQRWQQRPFPGSLTVEMSRL